MRFQTRIDAWILLLMVLAIAGQAFALVTVMAADAPGPARAIVILLVVPGISLALSILLRTHYTIDDGRLRIVSGPFAWTIAVADITGISESRSPLSSPALSLDRLMIRYGRNKRVLVSPADKAGFLRAIGEYAGQ